MHDIKYIREHPKDFDRAMKKRGLTPKALEIIKLDKQKRALLTELGELQAKRNNYAKQIGAAMRAGDREAAEKLKSEGALVNVKLKELEARISAEECCPVVELLETLPNILADDVPEGDSEEDNIEIRKGGADRPSFDFVPKHHYELGEKLGQMDFVTAARMSGSRFVLLKGALARMERALAQFMLDSHTSDEYGFEEVAPPYLVRDAAMYGTGQLPKFAEDSFRTDNGYWLIPTSEVSITNIVADSILDSKSLPQRFTAYTPCFRSEAGAAGKDTRGMIRLHQFNKVEMVTISHPDRSDREHEHMLSAAENILTKLGLHYRVMLLCSGDTGFSARKTYDLEVWLPAQDKYREISSVSNCGDFQARRMKARFRKAGDKKTDFVHTLNGSGLAVGRTLLAIVENYQQKDGSIVVPEVLRQYMGGMEVISV